MYQCCFCSYFSFYSLFHYFNSSKEPFNEVINDLESHCTSNDAFLHAAFLLNFIQSTNGLCCPKAWFHLDSTLSLHPSQCLWCFFFIYFPFFYSWGILPSNKGLDTVGLKGAHQPDEGSVGFFFFVFFKSVNICVKGGILFTHHSSPL